VKGETQNGGREVHIHPFLTLALVGSVWSTSSLGWLLYPSQITPVPIETIKETSRSVRLEQVNKWPNSMLAR